MSPKQSPNNKENKILVEVGTEDDNVEIGKLRRKISRLEEYIKRVDAQVNMHERRIQSIKDKNTDKDLVEKGMEILDLKKRKSDA